MNDVSSKSVCNSDEDKSNESKKPRIIIKNIHSKIKNQPKNTTKISIGNFFDYRDRENCLTVLCPVVGCDCGEFSKIFDRYDDNIKSFNLSQGNSQTMVNVINWTWDD